MPVRHAVANYSDMNSPNANGNYGVGGVITIECDFTNLVNVTGTPQLALNSGGTAHYSSGSGSSKLIFTYTVGVGQNTAKLDYASTTALTGTITDNLQTPVSLILPTPGSSGSLSAVKSISITA